VRGVKFFEERQGFSIVLGGEHRGQLRVERGIVGGAHERGAEEGFSVGILLAQNKKMCEAGVGGDRVGIFHENAAIGGFGGVVLAGLFSQLGGEESVFGSFRRELEGFEQVV